MSKQSKTKRKFVLVASDDQNEIVLKAEDEAEARHWIEMLNKRLEFLPKHLELSKQRGGRGRRKEAYDGVSQRVAESWSSKAEYVRPFCDHEINCSG